MPWRQLFYSALETRFKTIKKKNPRFSIRAYAKMAKISPAGMSGLLKRTDEWNLTPDRAVVIFEHIGVSEKEINHLLTLSNQKPKYNASLLPEKDYDILTDWTFQAILFSFDLSVPPTEAEMAEKFGISHEKVAEVIAELMKRGLLEKGPDQNIFRNRDQQWKTSDDIPSEVIRKHHLVNFDILCKAVQALPVEKRDVTSMTFAGSKEQFDLVKKEIRTFHERIFAIMDSAETKDEVFKVVVGLTPLTFSSAAHFDKDSI